MPLKHAIDGVTWEGFQHIGYSHNFKAGDCIAIVWFEGDPDLWIVDGIVGAANLRKYYESDWGTTRTIPIDIFTFARRNLNHAH